MPSPKLILVLGDQLTLDRGALRHADLATDTILLAEVAAEAGYVHHNRLKIALIFSAMRHFAETLRERGYNVIYRAYSEGVPDLTSAVDAALSATGADRVLCTEPGEYRVKQSLETWADTGNNALEWIEDDHFLCSLAEFDQWMQGRKQPRMEHFYRKMRTRHGVLLDLGGKPEGGRWNYDRENRKGWRGGVAVPERPRCAADGITEDVLALVQEAFPDNPGDLSTFNFAVTAAGAQDQLAYFLNDILPSFGTYQDALADGEPWLFHSLISMYLNIGLLDPLEVVQRTEQHWRAGDCELASAEGFIRQVLGWREYVRGLYWHHMPQYAQHNVLAADRALPAWFWNSDVDLRCLHKALEQSLDLGYAHHIQRLMVIGNFALLAGLSVQEVCDWYLAIYVDAFEWVELPNTLGMALFADGGIMASKPYAASGKYIQRQGDHCAQCRYKPTKVTGDGACPYNSLYWRFLDRHMEDFGANPRMSLALANWTRKADSERAAILEWADREIERLAPG